MRNTYDDDDDDTKSHGSTRRNSNNGKCKENRGEIIKSAILLPKSLRDLDNKLLKTVELNRAPRHLVPLEGTSEE